MKVKKAFIVIIFIFIISFIAYKIKSIERHDDNLVKINEINSEKLLTLIKKDNDFVVISNTQDGSFSYCQSQNSKLTIDEFNSKLEQYKNKSNSK